jgi:hypothetical protein
MVFFFSSAQLDLNGAIGTDVSKNPERLFNTFPWVIAGGYTVSYGISEFGGSDYQSISFIERYFLPLGLIVMCLIGPALFFHGWRESARQKMSERNISSKLTLSTLAFVIGGAMIAPTVISSVSIAYTTREVYNSMLNSKAVNEDKDAIISDLTILSFKALEHYAVSSSGNSTSASFAGFTIDPASSWGKGNPYADFRLLSTQDSSLTLSATSKRYPGSGVTVTVQSSLSLVNFIYTGKFE